MQNGDASYLFLDAAPTVSPITVFGVLLLIQAKRQNKLSLIRKFNAKPKVHSAGHIELVIGCDQSD